MSWIHVIGIGLEGANSLPETTRQWVRQATVLLGSARHLSYFPEYAGEKWVLGDVNAAIAALGERVNQALAQGDSQLTIAVLVSGDPLFFGLGRLLLTQLPADWLTFHPHLSSVQLAFNRIKVPWQDAQVISAHGRSLEELTQALQQGVAKIAVLTDAIHNPAAIARLLLGLNLAHRYQLWVAENLGGTTERVQAWELETLLQQDFAPLNVVVLLRPTLDASQDEVLDSLPILGLPDPTFRSFSDRPGLMTKREIRTLILAELALQPPQVIWDIGAGTGSVAIEIARLCPLSHIYAVEKTTAGIVLIQQNCQRLQVENVTAIQGSAPSALANLPDPDRVFIGGSGGQLDEILDVCGDRLREQGAIVLALATLEHQHRALSWLQRHPDWQHHWLQVQLARSIPVAALTRFTPLNPVTLVTIQKSIKPS